MCGSRIGYGARGMCGTRRGYVATECVVQGYGVVLRGVQYEDRVRDQQLTHLPGGIGYSAKGMCSNAIV
eukprot:134791-Rhodomonas_salina.1